MQCEQVGSGEQKVTDEYWQALTGQTSDALMPVCEKGAFLLHKDVSVHWSALAERARIAGFALQMASAWRGFERQLFIWNGKATGQRSVLDKHGHSMDITALSEDALLFAILRWSAIPGCSRHHWGTDFDVFDAAAVAPDYAVQLTNDECTGCGPFAALHTWLDGVLQEKEAVFFRPYTEDHGGIAPERWHLSCRPVAARYEALLDEGRLIDWIMTQDIALKERIYFHWHDIFHRYVLVKYDGRV
ncbi:MAG TPA: M15 family metallopeptidase [Pseudomonadales bacterium]|nr:M15 family metallopeptidase [Pseudomonadales bacterium]